MLRVLNHIQPTSPLTPMFSSRTGENLCVMFEESRHGTSIDAMGILVRESLKKSSALGPLSQPNFVNSRRTSLIGWTCLLCSRSKMREFFQRLKRGNQHHRHRRIPEPITQNSRTGRRTAIPWTFAA